MADAKYTPGPWIATFNRDTGVEGVDLSFDIASNRGSVVRGQSAEHLKIDGQEDDPIMAAECEANARLIAAAPALLEALREAIDLAWVEDSHGVQFDSTVMFSPDYDFSGIDGHERIEFYGEYECIVWPSGGIGKRRWSAYCTHEGSTWFEQFDTAEAAKEQCMRLLDKVLPDHPAMRGRAVIAKATGSAS